MGRPDFTEIWSPQPSTATSGALELPAESDPAYLLMGESHYQVTALFPEKLSKQTGSLVGISQV